MRAMAIPNPNPDVGSAVATELEDALAGALFPLSRRELVLLARENEAGEALVAMLSTLPEASFRSQQEVANGLTATGRPDTAE